MSAISEARKANIQKAQKAAHSPEVRAKAAATMRRRNAEKQAALLAHATITPGESIPLDAIPDKRKYVKKTKPWDNVKQRQQGPTRQEVVLALLKYLNGE